MKSPSQTSSLSCAALVTPSTPTMTSSTPHDDNDSENSRTTTTFDLQQAQEALASMGVSEILQQDHSDDDEDDTNSSNNNNNKNNISTTRTKSSSSSPIGPRPKQWIGTTSLHRILHRTTKQQTTTPTSTSATSPAPTDATFSSNNNTFPPGYDSTMARYLVGHSSAAYCKLHTSATLFECGCPNSSHDNAVDGFDYVCWAHNDTYDATGFCGVHHDKRVIVAAFRGTVSWTNWKANLIFVQKRRNRASDIIKTTKKNKKTSEHGGGGEEEEESLATIPRHEDTPFTTGSTTATSTSTGSDGKEDSSQRQPQPNHKYPKNVKVHTGFFRTYRSIQDKMIAAVLELKRDHPDYQIYVTGHSLGGAQATFCVADLVHKHGMDSVIGYTFGQPRVWDKVGQRFFDSLGQVQFYRIVNGLDPVPGLPGKVVGFRHVGHLIHFQAANKKNVKLSLQKNSRTALEGFSQLSLSKQNAGLHHFRIVDHLVYAERFGAPRILRGQDPPLDPWVHHHAGGGDKLYRNAVSATLTLFMDEAPEKPAVVLVYAPWCPHCKRFFPTFREFAKKYREGIQFFVIDGAANDCPEGYVPEKFPTIVLKRKNCTALAGAEIYHGSRENDAWDKALSRLMKDEAYTV